MLALVRQLEAWRWQFVLARAATLLDLLLRWLEAERLRSTV
jgi:hypothetical protein